MPVRVGMVAEKPSIAKAIADALSNHGAHSGGHSRIPVHEFSGSFQGQAAQFIVTAVTGHVYSTDFPAEYRSWYVCLG